MSIPTRLCFSDISKNDLCVKVFLTSFNICSAETIFLTLTPLGEIKLEGPVINVVCIPSLFSAIAIS